MAVANLGRSYIDPIEGRGVRSSLAYPLWARRNGEIEQRYTIGVEDEVMLFDPRDSSLVQSSDQVLARLSGELEPHTSHETHAAVVELTTCVHLDVKGVVAELGSLRNRFRCELGAMGLTAAAAGTHPLTVWQESEISAAPRYRVLGESMRALARREPTMALHVHVGVPAPEDGVRVLNRLRRNLPVLLALSGPEVLAENRFLAARHGMEARLIDSCAPLLIPVRELLEDLLAKCRRNGGLEHLVAELADRFLEGDELAATADEAGEHTHRPTERSGPCAAGLHTPDLPS